MRPQGGHELQEEGPHLPDQLGHVVADPTARRVRNSGVGSGCSPSAAGVLADERQVEVDAAEPDADRGQVRGRLRRRGPAPRPLTGRLHPSAATAAAESNVGESVAARYLGASSRRGWVVRST